MSTRVVNLRAERYEVYIGRSIDGSRGKFGNPYAVRQHCLGCGQFHQDAASTLPCFEKYFLHRLKTDLEFKLTVLGLEGKVLGCFCKPGPCHGDIIVAWLESL